MDGLQAAPPQTDGDHHWIRGRHPFGLVSYLRWELITSNLNHSMFLGHFGAGLGAKKLAPSVSLGTLFLATQFIDLLWPTFLLLGIEHVEIQPGATRVTPLNFVDYPFTHSLLMVAVWALAFGLVYWIVRKDVRGSVVLGAAVISHWVLDLIVHRPDLPLYPGDPSKLGLGLWNSFTSTLLVEGAIFFAGVALFVHTSRARNRKGTIAFWGLIVFLVLIYLGNIYGPVPQNVVAIAWAGHFQWLLVIWAYWIDRNHEPRPR